MGETVEVLNQHGLAVWIVVFLLVGVVALLGALLRYVARSHETTRRELAEALQFQRETLVHIVAESKSEISESTKLRERTKARLEKIE